MDFGEPMQRRRGEVDGVAGAQEHLRPEPRKRELDRVLDGDVEREPRPNPRRLVSQDSCPYGLALGGRETPLPDLAVQRGDHL